MPGDGDVRCLSRHLREWTGLDWTGFLAMMFIEAEGGFPTSAFKERPELCPRTRIYPLLPVA